MVASVTLLPALLGFAGRNIERLHVPVRQPGTHTPTTPHAGTAGAGSSSAGPGLAAIGGLAVLLALAAPFLGMRFGFPDAENDPPGYTTRHAYDLLADGFGPGYSAPMVLTVQGARAAELLDVGRRRSATQLTQVDGVALVSPALLNDGAVTPPCVRVVATTSPQDEATEDLVDTLRDDEHPRRHRGHRPDRRRRRHGGGQPRHHPGRRRSAAAVLRRRAAGLVRAADDGVPLGASCRSRPWS